VKSTPSGMDNAAFFVCCSPQSRLFGVVHLFHLQKFTGGITTKIPRSAFKITKGKEDFKVHEADDGSGVVLHREFCGKCGSGLLEYGSVFILPGSHLF